MKLGKSKAEATRLAVQQGFTCDDWPRFLDPDCQYAKNLRQLATPDEITSGDIEWFRKVIKERHPGKEIEE